MMAKMALLCVALCLWSLAHARGQEDYRADWFPFVVPDLADEQTARSLIDLSHLSPEPAGAHGFLRPDGERIVDSRGVEVKLFGSNICDYHPMPAKEDAPRIAERLRQLGINFIRLHYYDWDIAPRGILNPDRQTLNPEKLDQFDFLIANLKRCGVYVDINLHVARGYRDMPEGWHKMGKQIDNIHQPYIDSQRQYARDLLTHVNPYTGKAYVDEAAVAIIEFNNENSALQGWERYASLPPRFSDPLRTKWNAWLARQYRNTEGLRKVWNANPPHGPELLRNGDFTADREDWILQNSGGVASSTMSVLKDDEGKPFVRWRATRAGSQTWHLQFFQQDVPVEHGKQYVVTFKARGKKGDMLHVSLMHQQMPWHTVGRAATIALTSDWQECGASWTADNPDKVPTRLNFDCANRVGTYDIAAISLRAGGLLGLPKGQRVEDGTVPLVGDTSSQARSADYIAFLMDMELDYVRQMRDLIKRRLGAGSMLLDTQVSYGGLGGLVRESGTAEVIDCHAYPAHPSKHVDAKGRRILSVRNVSMTGGAFGGLESLAIRRVQGKPFAVSEFDLNPPNDHSSETFPMLALMAAYQGWAALAEYSWFNFQVDWSSSRPRPLHGHSRIRSHFATTGHAGQMALIPTASLLFRRGMVRRASTRIVLTVHDQDIPAFLAGNSWYGTPNAWRDAGGQTADAWRAGLACRLAKGRGKHAIKGALARPDGPVTSDTGQITFDRTRKGKEILQVNAPAVRLLIGRVAGCRLQVGDVTFDVQEGTYRDYANIALVAMDEKPIRRSRKLLLTVVARVENKGQKWNKERTSIGRDWGEGPTMAEPVRMTVTLPGKGWRAQALNGKGLAVRDVPMAGSRLTTGREHATVWYLLTR